MKLKRHTNFINELNSGGLGSAEEWLLEIGAKKVNGRWNFDGPIVLRSIVISRGRLLVPFGVISGDFTCNNEKLTNESLKKLPTVVKGNLNLSGNHFTDLEDFDVDVKGGIDLSHNHLHELKNMPKVLDGMFDIGHNMLTTLEGSPEEVKDFNCFGNWLKTAYGGPSKIHNKVLANSDNKYNRNRLDDKIPEIEQEFYSRKSHYNKEEKEGGIINYWTELFQYILEKFQAKYGNTAAGEVVRDQAITSIKWPNDVKGDLLKKSVKTVSKFGL